MSFVRRMYFVLLMVCVRFCEIVLCLVLSDDHGKKNKSKVHVFTFSSHVKNMLDLKHVKSHTCVNFLLRQLSRVKYNF